MKKILVALGLMAAAGSASAQSFAPPALATNFRPALSTFLVGSAIYPGGMATSSRVFLDGQITNGFAAGRNAFSGLMVIATRDTPLAALGLAGQDLFQMGYDILLPLYEALDEPAMRLSDAGAPLTDPLGMGAETLFVTLNDGLTRLPPLPGLE